MMIPSCEEILKLAADYDRIPICREVFADMVTPITLLRGWRSGRRSIFFWRAWKAGRNGAGIPF